MVGVEAGEEPLSRIVAGELPLRASQFIVGSDLVASIPTSKVHLEQDEDPEVGLDPDRDIGIITFRYEIQRLECLPDIRIVRRRLDHLLNLNHHSPLLHCLDIPEHGPP